jgi:AcrR family transcriptional regulator
MAKPTRGAERRDDALSSDRIIEAAIELLDAEGEAGLTFRALAARLATGAGAIYWHIANKQELLVAASDVVLIRALDEVRASRSPRQTLRGLAAALFTAIEIHPWAASPLVGAPSRAQLQIFERLGRQIQTLGVPEAAQFTAASALVSYILGTSSQNAAARLAVDPNANRTDFLGGVADQWERLDSAAYPFVRSVATKLREHDDLEEFLAGIDLIVGGIEASLAGPAKLRSARKK